MAIKYKALIVSIMLACIAGAAFIGWQRSILRSSMVRFLSTRTAIMAEICKSSLAFQDAEDAEYTLKALHVDSSLMSATVFDDKNTRFAKYYRDSGVIEVTQTEFKKTTVTFYDDSLIVCSPIVLDNVAIGTICLQSDLEFIHTTLRRSIQIIIAVLFLLIIIGLIVLAIYKARIFKAAQTPFPMNWFCFYTYFQLPCGVIAFLAEFEKMKELSILPVCFIAGSVALIVAGFIGLHKCKLWGWYLNWVLLAVVVLPKVLFLPAGDIEGTQFEKIGLFAGCLFADLLYILANVIYFWKRKVLFT